MQIQVFQLGEHLIDMCTIKTRHMSLNWSWNNSWQQQRGEHIYNLTQWRSKVSWLKRKERKRELWMNHSELSVTCRIKLWFIVKKSGKGQQITATSLFKFVGIITDSLLEKCKQNINKSHIFSYHSLSFFFFGIQLLKASGSQFIFTLVYWTDVWNTDYLVCNENKKQPNTGNYI